ncbi:MAG: FKBP-type peptidyl-prolyl cis-trans isomerase [Actinomycetota bacterium]|nr:FKBP-type peptidyl-prolyl cis-trans isomerase [Actinomycetota bacterium]
MRSPRLRLLGAALAPMILLAACGNDSDGGDTDGGDEAATTSGAPDDAAATSIAPRGDIADLAVEVQDQDGVEVPTLTLAGEPLTGDIGGDGQGQTGAGESAADLPFAVAQTEIQEVTPGEGEEVTADQQVTLRYLVVNGTTGQEVLSTFPTQEEVLVDLTDPATLPGFLEALPGTTPGTELIVAIPPADGFGPGGQPNLGVGPTDTLIFYAEVVSSSTPLTQAEGEAVEPVEGLPTVEADGTAPAAVTIPEGEDPPAELVSQLLIEGEGEPVEAGQQLTVHYTGVQWSDGSQFDSSLERGQSFDFQLGAGNVIAGWDEGLAGQPAGSRVLLVIPPDLAYGPAGEHELGGETLVFVVDILAAS